MEITKITPEQAADWLANNNKINRPISKSTVALYARLMAEGKWLVNGEAILFDFYGDLLNGQHRLAAIVAAGVPVETFVGRGFPPEYRDTMDQQRKRSAGDVLYMHGIHSGNHVAGVARVIYRWDQGIRGASIVGGGQSMLSAVEILDYIAQEPLIIPGTHLFRGEEAQALAPGRAIGSLWVLTQRVSPKHSDVFFDRLLTGEQLVAGNPILALRRYWANLSNKSHGQKRRTQRTGTTAFTYLQAGVRAWNSWARDEEMKVVVWKDTNLPEVEKAKAQRRWP